MNIKKYGLYLIAALVIVAGFIAFTGDNVRDIPLVDRWSSGETR